MEIHAVSSLSDFEEAHALINVMGKWDAEQSRKFGVPDVVLMEYIYGHTVETLMEKFRQRAAGFFLARMDKYVVGCAGYSKSDDGIAEIQKNVRSPGGERREAKALRRA